MTLLDIAQASGVSLTAVSLAMSDKPGISQDTRERILQTARSLGYRFKSSVASTAVRSLDTIGFFVSSRADNELYVPHFYSHIIAEISATCRQMGINLMFANLQVDESGHPTQIPSLLEKGDIDAFLIAGMMVDEKIAHLLIRHACPVVLFESYCQTQLFNAVLYDNYCGAYQATRHLIQKGHRHIGFIGGYDLDFPSFRDRRAGYQAALHDKQIEHRYFVDFNMYSASPSEMAAGAVNMVEKNKQISGLVCVNDDCAIAVINGLKENGINVPQDISIIGFDDIYMAESTIPSLTTMRVNKQSMGRLAVQLLLNQANQENGDFVTSLFHPILVERNSVAVIHP